MINYFLNNPIFGGSVADKVEPVLTAQLPAINFNELPTEVITYIINKLENKVKEPTQYKSRFPGEDHIVKIRNENNKAENIIERDKDKCNALGRYCMVNRTTRELCRTNKDIKDIIKLCKINKIRFINSKRPQSGDFIINMDYGEAIWFSSNRNQIVNKWILHDEIPDNLAEIAKELGIKKYCFRSTSTGYVVLSDNKDILLPEKGMYKDS